MNQFVVVFLTGCLSNLSSPVMSVTWTSFVLTDGFVKSSKYMGLRDPDKPAEELIFVLTKDAKLYVFDGGNGKMLNNRAMHLKKESTAISVYVIEDYISSLELSSQKPLHHMIKDAAINVSPVGTSSILDKHEIEHHSSPEHVGSERSSRDSLVLLCCTDGLRLYRLKSVLQGDNKTVHKVKLSKPCCWTSTIKRDDKILGLLLLHETGEMEVRSFPDSELVKQTSLMSILRWSFKANMNRTMSFTDDGQIALTNECEVAFISLPIGENIFSMM